MSDTLNSIFRASLLIIGANLLIRALMQRSERNNLQSFINSMNKIAGSPAVSPLALDLNSEMEDDLLNQSLDQELQDELSQNVFNDISAVNSCLTEGDVRLQLQKHSDSDRTLDQVVGDVYASNDCQDQFSRENFGDDHNTPFFRQIGIRPIDIGNKVLKNRYFKDSVYAPKMNKSKNLKANKAKLPRRNPTIDSHRYYNCPQKENYLDQMKSGQCGFQALDPYLENFASY